jgi:hypothetical protein
MGAKATVCTMEWDILKKSYLKFEADIKILSFFLFIFFQGKEF